MSTPDLPDVPDVTDRELAAAIDACFGDGPPPPPTAAVLAAAHRADRADRRRRTTVRVAVGGLLAAAVLAAAVVAPRWEVAAGGPETGVAGSTDAPPDAPPDEQPAERPEQPFDLGFTRDGEPRLGAGTELLRRIDEPLADPTGERTFALALRADGVESWVLAEWQPVGELISYQVAGDDDRTWEQWLDDTVRATGGWDYTNESAPPLVEPAADGSLAPGPGARITAERLGVDLGSRFALPGEDTAAAEVEADGNRWYVLARVVEGGAPEVIVVDPRDPASTFEGFDGPGGFLDWAAAAYGDGPTAGLR